MGGKKKVAVPPTFHLKMRLQSPEGRPFAERDYQITWGGKKTRGATDKDGILQADLDLRFKRGMLDLGEKSGKTGFIERITIPLTAVPTPPPPPPPAKIHDAPNARSRARLPPPVPLPPPPTPPDKPRPWIMPNSDASPEANREYQQTLRDWRDYDDAVERWNELKRKQKEDMSRRKSDPPPSGKPNDFNPAGRVPRRPPPASVPPPKLSPAARVDLEKRLTEQRDIYHAKQVKVYEIAWRLHNLGYLGWQFELQFPVEGSFTTGALLDALKRYTYRYRLIELHESDLTGLVDQLNQVLEHIRAMHEGTKS